MSTRDDLETAVGVLAKEISSNIVTIGPTVALELARAARDLAEAHRLLDPRGFTTQSGGSQQPRLT